MQPILFFSDEINEKQHEIKEFEQSFVNSEENVEELVDEAEMLRLLIGDIPSEGKGIAVSLQDGAYNPSQENPNDYIVHESHVFKVINELKISGAEASRSARTCCSGRFWPKCLS